IYPIYSNDNNYIAYIREGTFSDSSATGKRSDDEVIVKELSTGKEWKYSTMMISTFVFSPDDRFIALMQRGGPGKDGQQIIIWDFKNNKIQKILENIAWQRRFEWK
ncbi:MAG: hypothetical protein K6U74_09385, partial [Firmicutes bacterium]|nr:hypothetical protein [Bacillota bacterium]